MTRIHGQMLAGMLLASSIGTLWPGVRVALPADNELPTPRRLEWRGAGSCAAAACHGDRGAPGTQRCEYTTWMLHDKHAQAYTVLMNERSRLIVKNYRRLPSIKDAHPETDVTCLRCHSLDAEAALRGQRVAFEDGVSCERCHGAAEKWIGVHFEQGWKEKSAAEKASFGLRPLTDLRVRAQLCVECHVGVAGQDVDHDLIAAGHPRLNFELGSFLATLPPHWNMSEERERHPDYEARIWALGQVVAARTALELLEQRARVDDKPWPEFAEYDCYACHHGFQEPSWRQKPARQPPGSLAWGTWYLPMLPQALKGSSGQDDATLHGHLRALKEEMTKPLPERTRIARQARQAADELGRHAQRVERAPICDRDSLARQFSAMVREGAADKATSWDAAVQRYLALAALHNAQTDLDGSRGDPRVLKPLRALAEQLRFPRGLDSPPAFDPEVFLKQLRELSSEPK